MKVIVKADFPEAIGAVIEFNYPKQVEVVIDVKIQESLTPVPDDTVRFFVLSQPEGYYNKIVRENTRCYSYLLHPFEELFDLPNNHLFVGCGSFFLPTPVMPKKFGVSTIMSGRLGLPGHYIRRELFHRRNEIKIPFDFYLGTVNRLADEFYTLELPTLGWGKDEKMRAFDCMFHIAIDSYRRDYHFSEKLIDCFMTKTIPIYWGCTNIEKWFIREGMFCVETVDHIINCVNSLTEESYYSWRINQYVDCNYHRALEHYNYSDMLKRAILDIL